MPGPTVSVLGPFGSDSDAPVLAVAIRCDREPGEPDKSGSPVRAGDAVASRLADLGIGLDQALERHQATGRAGEVVDLSVTVRDATVYRVLLVGMGDGGPVAARRAGAALARATVGAERVASDTAAGLDPEAARAHLEGLLLAAYRFRASGAERNPTTAPLVAIDLHLPRRLPAAVRVALAAAEVTARAVHRARDLANTPSNEKDPAWLASQSRGLARRSGLDVTIRDERALAAEGFGGIVAVGAGSSRPPRLIELAYRPKRVPRAAPHVVLVGKGITFDTGGLSLKPRDAMVAMKTDMAAGGAVIAVMAALRDAGVRVPVTGLVPAAENMPGASALRPSDVITQYGGRTVEVFNTDAEGRLVLADALAYADARLDPDLLVDMATLTGAASQGLGRRHGALYSADETLSASLLAAGEASGDRLWRMPLVEDYRPAPTATSTR